MRIPPDKNLHVDQPTLFIDEKIVRENIRRMAAKAIQSNVLFRPHFKTHQSETIAEWFRDYGCTAITVSSFEMAYYFGEKYWHDVTIAIPVNVLQIKDINILAKKIRLNVVVDNSMTAQILVDSVKFSLGVFIKTDTGNKRCGIPADHIADMVDLCKIISKSSLLKFKGILSHSGHTYNANNIQEIRQIYRHDCNALQNVQMSLNVFADEHCMISIGDTPGCCLADFIWSDEIRPGNFVFNDLFQWHLGVCKPEDIACVMSCPVIGVYPERNEFVIYGGAVHFSKDFLTYNSEKIYGCMAIPDRDGELHISPENALVKIWQEHGLIRASDEIIPTVKPGDIVHIYPVHSCLTMHAMRNIFTTEGEKILAMS